MVHSATVEILTLVVFTAAVLGVGIGTLGHLTKLRRVSSLFCFVCLLIGVFLGQHWGDYILLVLIVVNMIIGVGTLPFKSGWLETRDKDPKAKRRY